MARTIALITLTLAAIALAGCGSLACNGSGGGRNPSGGCGLSTPF